MKFIKKLYPPERWRVPVIISMGIFVGLVAFLFHISRASSYLSDDPETCINCHVMVPQYATWNHSSHREETNCNDCHVPHDNYVHHYYFKAKDGLRHATIFTLRNEPQSIMIKPAGVEAVQSNCIRCHEDLIEGGKIGNFSKHLVEVRHERLCWDCHQEVPHGSNRSLSSTPNAIVPLPESAVPEWIRELRNKNNNE